MSFTIARRSTETQTKKPQPKNGSNTTTAPTDRMSIGPTAEKEFQSGDEVKRCPICKKNFGLTTWRHNCRWCGDVVCDDCSKLTVALPPMYPDPVRVCDLCKVPASAHGSKSAPRKLGTAATGGGDAAGASASAGEGPAPTASSTSGDRAATFDAEREKRAAALAARLQKSSAVGRPNASPASGASASEEAEKLRQQKEIRQRIYERDRAAAIKEKQEKHAAAAEQQHQEQAPAPASAAPEPEVVVASAPSASAAASEVPTPTPAPAPTSRAPPAGSNPMLEAAMRRAEAAKARGGTSAAAPSTVDPERTALLARITQLLQQQRKDEPFGLRSMEASKLRIYLRHLEGDK